MSAKIGVLAFQGAFREHVKLMNSLGAEVYSVRSGELEGLDGLVIPGGESTVIGRHMAESGLSEKLREMVTRGFPVLATCAGAILMAREIRGDTLDGSVGAVPMTVRRNAFGSQQDSFEAEIQLADGTPFPGIFIRAPKFYSLGQGIGIQAMLDEEPVAVSWKKVTLTSFHPELTLDPKIHKIFLRDCEKHSQ